MRPKNHGRRIYDTLLLPGHEGEGFIRGLPLEDGLSLRYAHFSRALKTPKGSQQP